MKTLVERLRNGETVSLELACGNVLTISPQFKYEFDRGTARGKEIEGFNVESQDQMNFATTEKVRSFY
jgi:hypothetical protein